MESKNQKNFAFWGVLGKVLEEVGFFFLVSYAILRNFPGILRYFPGILRYFTIYFAILP